MDNLLWDIFKKSGNIEAFLAYKDYENKLNFNNKEQFCNKTNRNEID